MESTEARIRIEPEQAEELRIQRWRFEQFASLGFRATCAELLAYDTRVDLAQARRLIGLGCPPETAARILL